MDKATVTEYQFIHSLLVADKEGVINTWYLALRLQVQWHIMKL
jgi:hypothetical protein